MSEFSECLEAMRVHYKASLAAEKSTPFVPEDRFSHFFSKDAKSLDGDTENVVGGLKDLAQGMAEDNSSKAKDGITKNTQTLKDKGVTAETEKTFREKMEEERQKTKERSERNIDELYDEAIKVGEANPEYQESIAATTKLANELFFAVWDRVKEFVVNLVKNIIAWIKDAWESIRSTFESITSTISGWFSFSADQLQPN